MNLENLRVLILDDQAESLDNSKNVMTSFLPEEDIFLAISAVEAMRILEYHPIDMAFVDIEMPDADGFSVAEFMRFTYPDMKLVFLTGHVELGAKSFDYEPFDFLSKPLDVMRLRKTFARYEAAVNGSGLKKELVALDTGSGLVMLSPQDILYVSKVKRKTVIHCAGRDYCVQYTLEEIETIFSDYGLFRTHQSFLAPLSKIVSVQPADYGKTYMAQMCDGSQIPMSRIQYSKLRGYLVSKGIRIL